MGLSIFGYWLKLILIVVMAGIAFTLIFGDKVSPGFPILYNVKRAQEKVFVYLKSSPEAKTDYYLQLLDYRLNELENLVTGQNYEELLSSSLRYSATAGELTKVLTENNLNLQYDSTLKKFEEHHIKLQSLLDVYPKDVDGNVEYKYLIDAQNYLKSYSEEIRKLNR
jgi:hypothetical protein